MRKRIISLVGTLAMTVATVGCQSSPSATPVRYDNVRFMDVWSTHALPLDRRDSGGASGCE